MNANNFEITGLTPYTSYTIQVRAIGEGGLGAIDTEVLQRTNSTTQDIVTATVTPTAAPSTSAINIHLPSPSQVQTGRVM